MAPGKIKFELSKPYYTAGEKVEGTCYLDVEEELPAKDLEIKWKGFERVKFKVPRVVQEGEETVTKTEEFKDEKTFFKEKQVLKKFEEPIEPGKYEFPFEFVLPDQLPGIFVDEKKDATGEYKAASVYKVKCSLDIPGKDIKKTEKIVVVPSAFSEKSKPIHEKNDKNFLLGTLIGKGGKIHMDVKIESSVFMPGQQIPIHVYVDNNSKREVRNVVVKLMRDVKLSCDGLEHSYHEEVNREKFEGVAKKDKLDKTLEYTLPTEVYPSTDGHLIDCQYHLDVELDLAMSFDLEVHPKVHLVYMPASDDKVWFLDNLQKGFWD